MRSDQGMDKDSGGGRNKERAKAVYVAQMIVCRMNNVIIIMGLTRKCDMYDNTQALHLGRHGNSEIIDSKSKLIRFDKHGLHAKQQEFCFVV